jgi:hypothetical protein
MNVMTEVQPVAQPRKRPAAKPSRSRTAERVKSTLILPLETSRRLTVYAAFTGADRSEVVARLIDDHLRRFVVQDRDRPAPPAVDNLGGLR